MSYGKTKKSTLVLALALSGLLASCGAKDADKVGEAQLCLDDATPGTAAACMEKIEGIDSPAASLLRCSAGFIDEGFTQPTRFQQAFDALGSGNTNSTEAFLGVLAFSSKSTADENVTFVTETYDHCVKSKAKGFMLLGSMAKTATTLAKLAGTFASGTQPSQTDIVNAINSAVSDPTAQAAIGSAVATTYIASCQTGAQSDKTLCDQFDTALANVDINDSQAVGAAVLNYWKNN